MNKKWQTGIKAGLQALLLAGCFLAPLAATAADINWDELEEKAKRYTGEEGEGIKIPKITGNSVNLALSTQPTGRVIDGSSSELSSADKSYILVHMKLANRHFSRKNYQRAIEEVELVFEKEPDNAGGRFMRAVIAGRMKDHQTAWHNIIIARNKDPQNPKISSFIDKLKTVSPEPEKPVSVPGIFRPIPISASEKACDILEKFLQHQSSQNVTNLTTEEYINESGSAWLPVTLEASSALSRDEVVAAFKAATGGKVELAPPTTSENPDKRLVLKIEIPGVAVENKAVKAVSELREFIKGLSEEIDVAISDTVERDAENKILDTTYEISVREFKTLNDFLRKVSPYSHKFRVLSMKLAFITGSQSVIWKCKVQVFFQQT